MGNPSFAVLYAAFAGLFLVVNRLSQSTREQSQIYFNTAKAYEAVPWDFGPLKQYEDISVPNDLYNWLKRVFIPLTFAETPRDGDGKGYCSEGFPCTFEEGHCGGDSHCTGNATCGDKTSKLEGFMINGNYWAFKDIQTWCSYMGTPLEAYALPKLQDPSKGHPGLPVPGQAYSDVQCTEAHSSQADFNSDVPQCCWDPLTNMAIKSLTAFELLDPNNAPVENPDAPVLTVQSNCGSGISPSYDCCSPNNVMPWAETIPEATSQHAMVGSFNRMVLIRINMKKIAMDQTEGKWSGSKVKWPVLKEDSGKLSSKTIFLNPSLGEEEMASQVYQLFDSGWFGQSLQQFSLDFVVMNGNVDIFQYVTWNYLFDRAGLCDASALVQSFNLRLFDFTEGHYLTRFMAELVLVFLVASFYFLELKVIKENGIAQYFKKSGWWLDFISLGLCTAVLAFQLIYIWQDKTFNQVKIPQLELADEASMQSLFADFDTLQDMFRLQSMFVAFNLLFVFVRAVMIVAELDDNLGLMLETFGEAASNLSYFMVMFMMLLIGFVLFAFFTFGTILPQMKRVDLCFLQVFSMLLGKANYVELRTANPGMAVIYFYVFYVFFYFIMLNMFISILLSGYDIVEERLSNSKTEKKDIFTQIIEDFRNDVLNTVTKKLESLVSLLSFLAKPLRDATSGCFKSCPKPTLPSFGSLCSGGGDHQDGGGEVEEQYRAKCHLCPVELRPGEDKKWYHKKGQKQDDKYDLCQEHYDELKDPDKKMFDEVTKAEDLGEQKDEYLFKDSGEGSVNKALFWEMGLQGIFMVNFVLFIYFQQRAKDSLFLATSLQNAVLDPSWKALPLREDDFGNIKNMQDVGFWADELVDALYQDVVCLDTRVPDGTVPLEKCSAGNEFQHITQRVNDWNFGFMNTTLVRLTMQRACYVQSNTTRFKDAYPYVRKTIDGECAGQQCSTKEALAPYQCYDSTGEPTPDVEKYPLTNLAKYWGTKQLGSAGLQGGFVVALGITKEEAKATIKMLVDELWFTKQSASLVFDWVAYNGNIDMFTFTRVKFSLLSTGKLAKSTNAQSFPLNIVGGGGLYSGYRMANMAQFIVYSFFVLGYVCNQIKDLLVAFKQSQRKATFFLSYYSNPWNISDTISLCLSVTAIVIFLMYMMEPFSGAYKFSTSVAKGYQVPNGDSNQFQMSSSVLPEYVREVDWYLFYKFEHMLNTYGNFLLVAALNSFFISFKVVKYVNALKSPKLVVFSDTLEKGIERNVKFTIIICLLLIGFGLFFEVLFGVVVPGLSSSLVLLVVRMFRWMLGDFGDEELQQLIDKDAMLTLIFFTLFELAFYFFFVNMYLATMMNTYSETTGRIDVETAKRNVEENRQFWIVDYDNLKQVKNDLQIDYDGMKKERVAKAWVKKVTPGGRASKAKIQDGGEPHAHSIFKINGEKDAWKMHKKDGNEIMHDGGIQEDPRDGRIRIMFKKAPPKAKYGFLQWFLPKALTDQDEEEGGKFLPTVKNFWRNHGAVTWTAQKVHNEDRVEKQDDAAELEVVEADAEEEDAEDDEKAEEAAAAAASADTKPNLKRQIKQRLDALLFSRGEAHRRGHAAAGGGEGHDDEEHGEDEGEQTDQDMDVDELRMRMETLPVTGDEAWLDCLISAIEHEAEDEYMVTEVFRTADMQEVGMKTNSGQKEKMLGEFYSSANKVLQILEFKAKRKYYRALEEESKGKQEVLEKQNQVLHDYACELEKEFQDIMQKIHDYKSKKQAMLTKLAGLIDRVEYKHLEKVEEDEEQGAPKHLARLTRPWPEARSTQA